MLQKIPNLISFWRCSITLWKRSSSTILAGLTRRCLTTLGGSRTGRSSLRGKRRRGRGGRWSSRGIWRSQERTKLRKRTRKIDVRIASCKRTKWYKYQLTFTDSDRIHDLGMVKVIPFPFKHIRDVLKYMASFYQTFKNGKYRFRVPPFLPLGQNLHCSILSHSSFNYFNVIDKAAPDPDKKPFYTYMADVMILFKENRKEKWRGVSLLAKFSQPCLSSPPHLKSVLIFLFAQFVSQ